MARSMRWIGGLLLAGLIAFAVQLMMRADSDTSAAHIGEGDSSSLYGMAQEEGEVNIWATNAEDLEWIPPAFSRAFPGIDVKIYTDLNVAARVITEARAGRNSVDVVWNSEALVRPLIERNLVIDNEWSGLGVRIEDVGADGHMAITSSVAFAVAYRKDRVAAENVPRTWEELVEDKYRGKMAASPVLLARLAAALGAFEGDRKWLEYARKFRKGTDTLWSNDLLEQAIVSGERPYVVATANYLAERWKTRGLPVEVVIPEPVFIAQFGVVVMRDAPHPNAARLLASWLASADGRSAREQALLAVDLRPSSNHPKAAELRASGKLLYVDTKEAMDARNLLIPEMDRIMSDLN